MARKDTLTKQYLAQNNVFADAATRISTKTAKGGKVDMCKAFQEIKEDARAEGRAKGRAEIIDFIKKQQAAGISPEQILQEIMKKPSRKTRVRQKRGQRKED
ncbi:MAG: hypothetical protein IJU50_10390 [Lachnospiraceae bacterium]|nr:hypothetical protein [Lachnospiraceae bacterium]